MRGQLEKRFFPLSGEAENFLSLEGAREIWAWL